MGGIIKRKDDDRLQKNLNILQELELKRKWCHYKMPLWTQYRNFLPEFLDATFNINIETQVAQTILSFLDVLPNLSSSPTSLTQPNWVNVSKSKFPSVNPRNSGGTLGSKIP